MNTEIETSEMLSQPAMETLKALPTNLQTTDARRLYLNVKKRLLINRIYTDVALTGFSWAGRLQGINFARYGLLDDQVVFFEYVYEIAPVSCLAVVVVLNAGSILTSMAVLSLVLLRSELVKK